MDTDNSIKLNTKDLSAITLDELMKFRDNIVEKHIPIWRKTADGRYVIVPVDRLEQYTGESDRNNLTFYIQQKWTENNFALTVEELQKDGGAGSEGQTGQSSTLNMERNIYDELSAFEEKSVIEREETLDQSIEVLSSMESEGNINSIESIIKMVEVIINSFYANYTNLYDNMSSPDVTNTMVGVYTKTEWIIQIMVRILRHTKINNQLVNKFLSISTGSHTLDHINKVFLIFSAFMIFYNNYIDKGMVSKNIRVVFKNKYLIFYKRKFKDENITVERVFKRGIKRIDPQHELVYYMIGALLFDIGKIPDLAYHDNMDEYNDNLVKKHVLNGYNMIVQARDYPFVVSAMAAFHHEYYFGEKSYRFTDPLLSKITRRSKQQSSKLYFMTYDEEDFKQGEAMSLFPCKVLEIIDVFDALLSKKQNSIIKSLEIMKQEFIAKNLKLDPMLFDIFLEFLFQSGLINDSDRKSIDDIKY